MQLDNFFINKTFGLRFGTLYRILEKKKNTQKPLEAIIINVDQTKLKINAWYFTVI